MSKRDVWELNNNQDVWRLAHYLMQRAESVDFAEELVDEASTDAFYLKCSEDMAFFAPRCLRIKGADAKSHLFEFNRAQWYLHTIAEWMIHKYGMVRIIVVKGRQQGISTYLEGRAYWKTIHRENYNVTILTHEAKATNGLFDMAKRYHDKCPDDLKPMKGADNAKMMKFPDLDSQYSVATAGAQGTGRSATSHYFHGSEVAFWPDAEEHASGIMQTVRAAPDTEIYLESTADGIGNYFHEQWQSAEAPTEDADQFGSGYIRVFIPWYWEPAYVSPVPDNFSMTEEEAHEAMLYDLSDEQIMWRRKKISEMNNDPNRFKRDYPCTPEDAFNSSGDNILIRGELIAQARFNHKHQRLMPVGAVVMGVDVARMGDDATAFVVRQGRVVLHRERMVKQGGNVVASRITVLQQRFGVDHTFIDGTGGFGTGVYDVLVDRGRADNVTCVHFSESADEEERFNNIRTEMWWKVKEWLESGASLPDSDDWGRDLCAPHYKYQRDMIALESKDEIKKRIKRSPDIGDALALTFRFFVQAGGVSQGYSEPEVV